MVLSSNNEVFHSFSVSLFLKTLLFSFSLPTASFGSNSSLGSSSASVNSAPDSHRLASGHYSISPERPTSEESWTTSEGCQSATTSIASDKRQSLKRGSSASGNEYGDEVPLSMI